MRQAEPGRDSRRRADGPVGSGRDHAVDALRQGQSLDDRLVLDRHDRPAVGVPEAGRTGVAVDGDHEEAAGPGRCEQAELSRAGPEHKQTLHGSHCRESAGCRPF